MPRSQAWKVGYHWLQPTVAIIINGLESRWISTPLGIAMAGLINHFYIYILLHFTESYYSDIWISAPPLLIEDNSLTVYFCSGYYFFHQAYRGRAGGIMRAAITETGISSTWNYTDYLISCYRYDCLEFYYRNVTNYLLTHHTFSSLLPNTLYSLEFLGCLLRWPYYSCTVGNSYFSYRVNITTRPEGEQ